MSKTSSADGAKLGARFDEVRQRLLQSHFADRLARPLEYWVLPSDRRLPLALLNRTLNELLATPFTELSATPGIGQKKISSLVKLLDRATRDEPPMLSVGWDGERRGVAGADSRSSVPDMSVFDPSIVSEALWSEWREAVAKAGVGHEKLGRVAPSLQRLPTVIWQTPLSQYLNHSVAEIRQLRTHGEKRVRCVLEVFHSVYYRLTHKSQVAGQSDAEATPDSLCRQLTPSQLRSLEHWLTEQLASSTLPSREEVHQGFVVPLMDLIETDCGSIVANLVSDRLGLLGPPRSVREQARELTVTRARIYQLLDDCGKTMAVRWPQGPEHLNAVTEHFSRLPGDHQSLRLFFGLRELCFPAKQRGDDDDIGFGSDDFSTQDARSAMDRTGAGSPEVVSVEMKPRKAESVSETTSDETAAKHMEVLPPDANRANRVTDREALLRPDEKSRPETNSPHLRPSRIVVGEPAQTSIRIGTQD